VDDKTTEKTYEEKIEEKFQELGLKLAIKKWPTRKELAENFVIPFLNAKDPLKTARVLLEGGKNNKMRRLKLAESLRMCSLLDVKHHMLLADAIYEVDKNFGLKEETD